MGEDKMWRAGHRAGYLDAISEIWKIASLDYPDYNDPDQRTKGEVLYDLAGQLRQRYDRALEVALAVRES